MGGRCWRCSVYAQLHKVLEISSVPQLALQREPRRYDNRSQQQVRATQLATPPLILLPCLGFQVGYSSHWRL